jgi:hypothetical protein
MMKKPPQRVRSRKLVNKASAPLPPMASVTSVTASGGSQVTIVFGQSVQISLNNLPATWRFGTSNRTLTALVSGTGTTYVFTVSGTVATSQVYSMPGMDQAARTNTGGYVAAASGTLV